MPNLAFAKLVATPTETSWSQVYNAGNLFASLSLSKDPDDQQAQLSSIGKDLFSHLESEFFTLEDKNLKSIKEALANSTHKIPSSITANLSLAFFKENILYVFIFGKGTIIIKRAGKTGLLLEENIHTIEIKSASGFLQANDTIILQTPQFAEDMPIDNITSSLNLETPEEIAEALSPTMHEKDDGGQAAIIINYQRADEVDEDEDERQDKEDDQVIAEQAREQTMVINESSQHLGKKIAFPKLKLPAFWKKQSILDMNHKKKFYLSIFIIILLLLFVSIFLTKKGEEDKKTAVLFESVYNVALKKYENGLDIKSINKSFAQEDFLKSQKILKDGQSKFKKGTREEKQISELLSKIESELGGATAVSTIKPKVVDDSKSNFLSIVKDNSDAKSFANSTDTVYSITDEAIASVDKNGSKKEIIKNDDDWKKPVGIAAYQGNIYILDQENGVLKYTSGSDGFGKTAYFKEKPDLENATALAIDGSVWILFRDGTISKYTKGISDGFKISLLDKPFNKPTKIITDINTDNLYILDSGNSRIVKLSKSGNFENQYNADVLKTARDFEVNEKDGKIFILSQDKIFEIKL